MHLIRRIVLLLVVLNFANESHAQARDDHHLRLLPENPHYFQWQGKPAVLVTSGEHYGALLNLDFDYCIYFDELQRHGLNHTRIFSGVYREDQAAFNITDNTLAPPPNRFICPWARSDEAGYAMGGNKFDLNRWDDAYFARLKDLMSEAASRGIIVELTLFCPMYEESIWNGSPMNAQNNVNQVGRVSAHEVHTLKHPELLKVQIDVTRKIISELREFKNLYYEICNEPYFGGVTMEWQERIVATISETERDFNEKHLISLNIANGRQRVEQAPAGVSILNFHYCVPPDTVAMNYDLNLVIGENETGFRGSDDLLYRTEGWDFMLAGGALYNNLDYSFTTKHPDGSQVGAKSPGGGSRQLREHLGILKRFLESFDFAHMTPATALIQSVSSGLTATALAQPGESAAIYMHVNLLHQVKDLIAHVRPQDEATIVVDFPSGRYQVQWLNPLTGITELSEVRDHVGGNWTLTSPPFENDIALGIRKVVK